MSLRVSTYDKQHLSVSRQHVDTARAEHMESLCQTKCSCWRTALFCFSLSTVKSYTLLHSFTPSPGSTVLVQDLHKRSQSIGPAMNSICKFLIALSLFTVILSFSTNSRNLREMNSNTFSVMTSLIKEQTFTSICQFNDNDTVGQA